MTEALRSGLLAGTASGAAALTATAVVVWAFVPRRKRPPPVAGPALLIAVAIGFAATTGLSLRLTAGLLAAGAAAACATACRWPQPLRIAAAVPGAALVAAAGPPGTQDWVRAVAFGTTLVAGPLLADFDRRWSSRGLTSLLLAPTAIGIFLAVPDTEHAVVVAGGAGVLALLGLPVPVASFGLHGGLIAAGLLSWTAMQGGVGRPASVIGATACFGALVVEPVVRRRDRPAGPPTAPGRWSTEVLRIAVVHAAVVVVAARVVAPRGSLTTSVGWTLALLTAASVVLRWRAPRGVSR